MRSMSVAREMRRFNGIPRCGGQINPKVVFAIALTAIVVLAAAFWLLRKPAPEPIPAPGRPLETVAPAESAAERGDSAREIIDELRSGQNGVNYAEAYERAREFQSEGRFADAQLLYFFAARGGHGPAAFDLASFYDPTRPAGEANVVDEPDPFQAYRWYKTASEAGDESAAVRLTELRAWAAAAAGTGDPAAERLLLQWE